MKRSEEEERKAGTVQMIRNRRHVTKWKEPMKKLTSWLSGLPVPNSPQANRAGGCVCVFVCVLGRAQ